MLSLVVRLKAVYKLPVDYDEENYLFAAQHYAESIRQRDINMLIGYEFNYEHPPLAKIVYGLSILALPALEGITGSHIDDLIASSMPAGQFYAMRLVSAALGTWQVLAMALIDPLAAFFLAINTWQIKYTSQIMLEPLPALTSLLTVMFYRRSQSRWNRWLFFSAMALGIPLASKYPYGIVGLAILLDMLVGNSLISTKEIKGTISRSLFPIIGWGALSILFFLLFNPRMWSDPLLRFLETVTYHVEYSQNDRVSQIGFPSWQPFVWLFSSVPWHPDAFLIGIDALVALLAMVGYKRLWGESRVFALWLVLAIGFLLIWPTKWPQYILILTAPLSLSASVGFRTFVYIPIKDQWYQWRVASR